MIVLTSDGIPFDVSKEVADLSEFLSGASDDDKLHIPHVTAREFEKVVRFCHMHVEEPMGHIPIPLRVDREFVNTTYSRFADSIDVQSELIPLLIASDFLGVEPLVSLLCAKIAMLAETSDNVDGFLHSINHEISSP